MGLSPNLVWSNILSFSLFFSSPLCLSCLSFSLLNDAMLQPDSTNRHE